MNLESIPIEQRLSMGDHMEINNEYVKQYNQAMQNCTIGRRMCVKISN